MAPRRGVDSEAEGPARAPAQTGRASALQNVKAEGGTKKAVQELLELVGLSPEYSAVTTRTPNARANKNESDSRATS
jgi:hypothetical protein